VQDALFRANATLRVTDTTDPTEITRINLNNESCEASRDFRNKKRKYVKDKTKELPMNSKNTIFIHLYSEILLVE
jgi:5,10-methenyltetrahydromethanopterin hydrogenase